MKQMRRVFTMDAAVSRRRVLTPDELLSANSPGKVQATGARWDGSLGPKYDMLVEQSEKLHGFLVNHVVGAEPSPVIDNLLGRVWRGSIDMQNSLSYSDTEIGGETAESVVDTSEALAAVNQLRQSLGTERINKANVGDAVRRMKRARDAVRGKAASRSTVSDTKGYLANAREATRNTLDSIRSKAAKLWSSSPTTATQDSVSETRNALHVANATPAGYFKNASLNDVNKAFWAGPSYTPAATQDGQIAVKHPAQPNKGPLTIAEINQRNREYWDTRR